jgi:putative endonuclease
MPVAENSQERTLAHNKPCLVGVRVIGGETMGYSLYIVECADGTFYTGIATDVRRRVLEHNSAKGKGARYTSARRPVVLVFETRFATRSDALKEEARIKQLTRHQKQTLISAARAVTATSL